MGVLRNGTLLGVCSKAPDLFETPRQATVQLSGDAGAS